jgi:hypothetical protein
VSVDGKKFEFKGLVFDNSVLELEFVFERRVVERLVGWHTGCTVILE